MTVSEYLVTDPVWYDQLHNAADDGERYAAARLDPPAGWERAEFDGWVAWKPVSLALPPQGWKIHVSAVLAEADEVITIVTGYCADQGLAVKFLRSRTVYLLRNEKYAARAGSGKLCAIYPASDEQLEQALRRLSAALAGRGGPYILSDLRWRQGPLYLRYGGFLPQRCVCPDSGDLVPALYGPGGALIPDARKPVFSVPEWAPVPGFIREQITDAAATSGAGLPYRVRGVLHFSNGGGIYRAADPATGATVILREARPGAGLDVNGQDAVSRLASEQAALQRLAGLAVAPALLDRFTCWEHHYLAQEYIEGELLQHAIGQRYPMIYPGPEAGEVAGYVRWAMSTLAAVEAALAAVHSRGLVFGDLHPFNVIVRPDGRAALVDFEVAAEAGQDGGRGLGAPGFVPPWPVSGVAADDYALNCLRLAFFLPLTTLLGLDPGKAPGLVRVAARLFSLPDSFAAQVTAGLSPPARWDERAWRAGRPGLCAWPPPALAGHGSGLPGERETGPGPGEWARSMTAAIMASATPDRADRLFPGDYRQFAEGGVSIAHGAAGVLYALDAAGGPVPPGHLDWLSRAALAWPLPGPGGYGGLDGVAAVLARLGRAGEGLDVARRGRPYREQIRRAGLYDGLAGAGLALLSLSAAAGDPGPAAEAVQIAGRLRQAVAGRAGTGVIAPSRAGLMEGWAGPAALFLAVHDQDGEDCWLDAAQAALRLDLARCVTTRTGGLQAGDGARVLLYLGTGSAGIGVVARALLARRPDSGLAAAVSAIAADLGAEFAAFSGLFEGRAGLIVASLALAGDSALAGHHLRRLPWHALCYRGHAAFPGSGLQRLSMDLATGTAGVLLAVAAMRADTVTLPLLDHIPIRRPQRQGGR
ncbi:MAG TPA: class III lanthionine synthetase LanKC [Streptosporangiaceae bacterium]